MSVGVLVGSVVVALVEVSLRGGTKDGRVTGRSRSA